MSTVSVPQDFTVRKPPDAAAQRPALLTKREREVLLLLSEGHSAKEVAAMLFISKRTVDFHTANMYSKFQVCRLLALLKVVHKAGLLQETEAA